MAISGELLSVDLSNVFQMLSLNRKRGLLHVRDQENILNERWIVFDEDRIGLYEIPKTGDVWGLLVHSGDVSYEDYRDARKQAGDYGSSHDRLLRQRGIVDSELVDRAARRLQEEMLLEIFLWREVSFSLDEERVPEPLEERELYGIDLLVMEAARRQDEWLRAVDLLGGDGDVWALPPMPSFAEPPTEALTPGERVVFDFVDGVRGTTELMAATGLPRFHVDLALCRLMQQKLLRRLTPAELVVKATELLGVQRHADAIRLLELANLREGNSGNFETSLRLAEAHLARNEISRATEYYKECAEKLLDVGQVREAIDILHDVLVHVPTDFGTLKRAIDLVATHVSDYTEIDEELFGQGVKLFHFHLESSRYDEANDLLALLLEIAPNDVGLNVQRARLLVKTGYVEEGVDIYLKVAARLFAAKDIETAERLCKTVRGTDPINERVRSHCEKRLEQIAEIKAKRTRRKRAGMGIGLLLAAMALAGGGYFVYQDRSSSALEEMREENANPVTSEDWRDAKQAYDRFARRHPLTFASTRAAALSSEADKMIARFEREEMLKQRAEEKRRQDEFRRAEEAFSQAVVLQNKRELRRARAAYESALEIASGAGRRDWALEPARDVANRIDGLTAHIEREAQRVKEYRAARERGDLAAAFDVARAIQRDALGESLQAKPLVVIDRETLADLRLPFRVDRVPAGASLTVDGQSAPPGAVTFELAQNRKTARVSVSAPGYREVAVEIDWERSPHENVVILERAPRDTFRPERAIIAWLVDGDRPIGIDRNGGLYRFADNGRSIEKTWAPPALLSLVGSPESVGEGVLVVGQGGASVIDPVLARRTWQHPVEGTVTAWARRGHRILVASTGEKSAIELLQLGSVTPVARWETPGAVRDLAWCEAGFAATLSDGRVLRGEADRPELTVTDERARVGRLVSLGSRVLFAAEDGSVRALDPRGGAVRLLWEPTGPEHFVTRGPEATDRHAFFVDSRGAWFVADPDGGLRSGEGLLPSVDPDRTRTATPLHHGRGLLVPDAGGGYLEVDLDTGRRGGRLRHAGRIGRAALHWRDSIRVSYDGTSEVELYPVGR
ncbi:MAG: DUF4388 domain-containing protein [Planctomycetota bacterium]